MYFQISSGRLVVLVACVCVEVLVCVFGVSVCVSWSRFTYQLRAKATPVF